MEKQCNEEGQELEYQFAFRLKAWVNTAQSNALGTYVRFDIRSETSIRKQSLSHTLA